MRSQRTMFSCKTFTTTVLPGCCDNRPREGLLKQFQLVVSSSGGGLGSRHHFSLDACGLPCDSLHCFFVLESRQGHHRDLVFTYFSQVLTSKYMLE